jgi:hypothetical protein
MKTVSMLLALLLALPSLALAVKIKEVDIDPNQPKAGDTVLFTVKTDRKATKVEIDFPAVPGPPVKMQPNKEGDKWQIKLKVSKTGEKKFKVTAYDKKGKKDSEEKKFQVGGEEVAQTKPQPQPKPQPAPATDKKPSLQGGSSDPVLNKIKEVAVSYCGKSSGPSRIGVGSPWLTDTAGGDGNKIQLAFEEYSKTRSQANMKKILSASYKGNDLNTLVNRIIYIYNSKHKIPKNDQDVLDLLEVRRQCFEWANTIAVQGGGHTVAYDGGKYSVTIKNIKEGMGLYKRNKSHAMIVIKVEPVNNGVRVRVAESNYASNWFNPLGDVPWERTVSCERPEFVISNNSNEYIAVDYAK